MKIVLFLLALLLSFTVLSQDCIIETQQIIGGLIRELNDKTPLSRGPSHQEYVDLCIGEERRKELGSLLHIMKSGVQYIPYEHHHILENFIQTKEDLENSLKQTPDDFLRTLDAYNKVWKVIDAASIPASLWPLHLSPEIFETLTKFPFSYSGCFHKLIEWSYGLSWDWLSNLRNYREDKLICEKLYN